MLALSLAGPGVQAAEFRPEAFFAGRTRAAGAITDASGQPAGRFTGQTRGRRERDGSTVFDQTIRFDDGTVRQRRWRVIRTAPSTITVTGSDIVGEGRGEIAGDTLRLATTIRWQAGNPLSDLDFEQVLIRRPDGTVDNSSTVRKLGFVVQRAEERFVRVGARR